MQCIDPEGKALKMKLTLITLHITLSRFPFPIVKRHADLRTLPQCKHLESSPKTPLLAAWFQ